ncbi:MAG TPA: LLM class flavin-dependent oxidoreductase [Acidimicrobiales bacterium]
MPAGGLPQFFVFVPQMLPDLDALVERARVAEEVGFTGFAVMDHIVPPGTPELPVFEAMTTATWLAAHTDRLVISHLVLCDSFRHPVILAKQAVTLDHATGGRYELAVGSGSWPEEMAQFGIGDLSGRKRVERLGESLEVIKGLWTGEPVTFEGEHFQLRDAQQRPTPLGQIPILIGGAGPRTLDLVRRHADWCNVPVDAIDRIDHVMTETGARASMQHIVGYVPKDGDREKVEGTARRRYAGVDVVVGDDAEMIEHYRGLADRGLERFYVWFHDFARPETLAGFAEGVIAAFR